jgi:hypothetical protein
MGATPLGAERHYTHSYATFLAKLKAEPEFACWLQAIETDLAALLTGPSWMGEANNSPHRWDLHTGCVCRAKTTQRQQHS